MSWATDLGEELSPAVKTPALEHLQARVRDNNDVAVRDAAVAAIATLDSSGDALHESLKGFIGVALFSTVRRALELYPELTRARESEIIDEALSRCERVTEVAQVSRALDLFESVFDRMSAVQRTALRDELARRLQSDDDAILDAVADALTTMENRRSSKTR